MSNEQAPSNDIGGKMKQLLSGEKRYRWIVGIGAVGVLLIALSAVFPKKQTDTVSTTFDAQAYVSMLEMRLETMVSSIDGAGEARVMVTLENGVEYVYAGEEKVTADQSQNTGGQMSQSNGSQTTVVTVDAANGKEGLIVTQIQPTVRGVVVACKGADDEVVAARVKEAVKTALDIADKRVCVIPYT